MYFLVKLSPHRADFGDSPHSVLVLGKDLWHDSLCTHGNMQIVRKTFERSDGCEGHSVWKKPNNTPPNLRFIPPTSGEIGDGLFLGFPHYSLILLISVHFANVLPQITIFKGRWKNCAQLIECCGDRGQPVGLTKEVVLVGCARVVGGARVGSEPP